MAKLSKRRHSLHLTPTMITLKDRKGLVSGRWRWNKTEGPATSITCLPSKTERMKTSGYHNLFSLTIKTMQLFFTCKFHAPQTTLIILLPIYFSYEERLSWLENTQGTKRVSYASLQESGWLLNNHYLKKIEWIHLYSFLFKSISGGICLGTITSFHPVDSRVVRRLGF